MACGKEMAYHSKLDENHAKEKIKRDLQIFTESNKTIVDMNMDDVDKLMRNPLLGIKCVKSVFVTVLDSLAEELWTVRARASNNGNTFIIYTERTQLPARIPRKTQTRPVCKSMGMTKRVCALRTTHDRSVRKTRTEPMELRNVYPLPSLHQMAAESNALIAYNEVVKGLKQDEQVTLHLVDPCPNSNDMTDTNIILHNVIVQFLYDKRNFRIRLDILQRFIFIEYNIQSADAPFPPFVRMRDYIYPPASPPNRLFSESSKSPARM